MKNYPFDTDKLIKICRDSDISMVGVFGSMARGDHTEKSDIDLVVKFTKKTGFFALVRLERELSDALGKKVDLLTENAISPYLREEILDNLQVLYGER